MKYNKYIEEYENIYGMKVYNSTNTFMVACTPI